EAVREHGHGEVLDVVREHVVAPGHRGERLGGAQELERRAGRGAEPQAGVLARRGDEREGVPLDGGGRVDRPRDLGEPQDGVWGRRWPSGWPASCVRSMRSSASASGYPAVSRAMNRSRCASGRGHAPSISTGFCVATTRNGLGSWWVAPSTVVWPSSMHSSSADCVLGEARLISSPMTMLENTGPGRNSNSWFVAR